MLSCSVRIPSFEFPEEEIEETVRNRGLLSIEIEFSLACNYRCPYCYVSSQPVLNDELTQDEIRDVIRQAKDLGAKKIIILGGEPFVYPHILPMIGFIRSQGLIVEVFTNGSLITADTARRLRDENARVVLKMNSLKEDVQDRLTGRKGAYRLIRQAFENLLAVGYPSREAFLAASTVISSENIDELPQIWQWLRDQGIAPYFEMITPQGNARENGWLDVDVPRIHRLFEEIARIDRERYGLEWDPQPPLMANRCLRHRFSCLITSRGNVMPCVGVTVPVGNVREQRLADILSESEVIQDLRNFRNTIQGPCHHCEKADSCYGCRGAAYQLTGNYLASDPLCWRNLDCRQDIVTLPVPVNGMIPQQSPMRMVDTLNTMGERCAEVAVRVSEEMPFVDQRGRLDDVVYLELIAQAIAAHNGFKHSHRETAPEGLLLGARKIEIFGPAHVGDLLKIKVFKLAKFGDFGIVKGTVSRNGDVLASGEIKIWHNSQGNGGGSKAAGVV